MANSVVGICDAVAMADELRVEGTYQDLPVIVVSIDDAISILGALSGDLLWRRTDHDFEPRLIRNVLMLDPTTRVTVQTEHLPMAAEIIYVSNSKQQQSGHLNPSGVWTVGQPGVSTSSPSDAWIAERNDLCRRLGIAGVLVQTAGVLVSIGAIVSGIVLMVQTEEVEGRFSSQTEHPYVALGIGFVVAGIAQGLFLNLVGLWAQAWAAAHSSAD